MAGAFASTRLRLTAEAVLPEPNLSEYVTLARKYMPSSCRRRSPLRLCGSLYVRPRPSVLGPCPLPPFVCHIVIFIRQAGCKGAVYLRLWPVYAHRSGIVHVRYRHGHIARAAGSFDGHPVYVP